MNGTPAIAAERWIERRQRLEASLERRNRAEFVSGGIGLVVLLAAGVAGLANATESPETVAAVGNLVLAAGLVYVLWRLRSHAADAAPVSPEDPKTAFIERMQRERNHLRHVWSWYIGPLLPGFVLIWSGLLVGGSVLVAAIGFSVTLAFLFWISRANRIAADELDAEIRDAVLLGTPPIPR